MTPLAAQSTHAVLVVSGDLVDFVGREELEDHALAFVTFSGSTVGSTTSTMQPAPSLQFMVSLFPPGNLANNYNLTMRRIHASI